MPLLRLSTNATADDTTLAALNQQLSAKTAAILGKPEAYVMVESRLEVSMSFGGSADPCAFFEVFSLGEISGEQAKRFAAEISEVLEGRLGVPAKRIYSAFHPWDRRDLWGYGAGTFAS